jgi:aryl-alcohol dehydrogenase-like predicted oxidoreductase
VLATKFPPSPFSRTNSMPEALDASLARLGRTTVDLYQHLATVQFALIG